MHLKAPQSKSSQIACDLDIQTKMHLVAKVEIKIRFFDFFSDFFAKVEQERKFMFEGKNKRDPKLRFV